MQISIELRNEVMTRRLGTFLGKDLRKGEVVFLYGEMGTGKSVLARAVARSIGVTGPIPSPTFTILNIYDGNEIKMYHFDLYRLEDEQELRDAGLDEFIGMDDGISIIEWPDQCDLKVKDALEMRFEYMNDDADSRIVRITTSDAFSVDRISSIIKKMTGNEE